MPRDVDRLMYRLIESVLTKTNGTRASFILALSSFFAWAGHPGAVVEAGLLQVRKLPPVMNSVAAFPRVVAGAPAAAIKHINAVLARADARVRRAAADCLGRGKKGSDSEWSRKVTITMQGPRYLSLVASDDYYCSGAAYPDMSTVALVFDLKNGTLIDWAKLLPGTVQSTGTDTAGDGSVLGTIRSDRLAAFFRKAASTRDPECDEALKDRELDFILWPDTKQDGIVMEAQLPHVIAACGTAISIPVETLGTFGVNAELLEAINSAHRKGGG